MSRSRLVIDLSGNPANPRASSTKRNRGNEAGKSISSTPASDSTIYKRQTRQSAASAIGNTNGNDNFIENLPPALTYKMPNKKKGKDKPTVSRASMSSVSTVQDSATSSGYSTPATSAAATPAVLPKQESSSRSRGRPTTSLANTLPPTAMHALQRAKNLRNSKFSLNPVGNKRKRFAFDDEDEDDSDSSPDAKFARALQNEENKKTGTFDKVDSDEITPRRARRRFALRSLRPKSDYVDDLSNDEVDIKPTSARRKSSVPAISLKAKTLTSNSTKRAKIAATDSEEEESEFVISDSDDDFLSVDEGRSSPDVPLATLSATRAVMTEVTQARVSVVIRQQPDSSSSRGRTSKGHGPHRDRSQLPPGRRDPKGASKIANGSTTIASALLPTDEEEDDDDPLLTPLDLLSDLSRSDDEDDYRLGGLHRARRVIDHAERYAERKAERRARQDRARLEAHHPELLTMWKDLENLPAIKTTRAEQPTKISRQLKPFQLEGLSWMQAMEKTTWGGGLLGDEMGMGKTIQAVSLIMSDYPAKSPSLVLIPPVALMQWQQEIGDYTDGTLKTFVFHGTNKNTKGMSVKDLKKYDVILMSYNSLESMFRHQEKGFKRKEEVHFQKSVIHQLHFHRVILDEAHNIKTRTTGVAKACFALKADHKWCLSGTPLQNRIGEFFSLVRFLDIRPFACYFCKQCPCSTLEWTMNAENRCIGCSHSAMQHVSVFNQELLNPIQKYGNNGPGKVAFGKLRLLTDRFMLRRVKRDHSAAMELPAKEIQVDRQFFGEEENDFAASIMNNGTRKFETYVAQGVLLNNYANIFGLIMQMRQVADHPDLILKKNGEGGQNILVCCICDEAAEDAIRSTCRHDFCRSCAKNYLKSSDETDIQPDCPQCHIPLSIDLEQPEMEQDQQMVKKSSIINRIKMENWTSSSKIEALVHDLHSLRSHNSSSKSIIFSQFTTMLQLVEWRLRRAGITTVMLDGSMTPAQRQASINHFMTDVNVECFLVSLKAGGVALNLTEASKVFIVDPWWNPAAEWQSADRCHRIGQCRPCSITRLCIEDSVESRMVLLQEKKANMINSTINADDTAMESLTPEDMQFLFRGN